VQGTLVSAAESAFAYTERTETLRKITHHVPISREQIEDVPGLLAEIQAEMREGVLAKLSSQIIVGTGTAPQIEGFLDAGRTEVNSQAKGADDVLTAIRKGIRVNESTGFANVDTILMNPTDWANIQTLKTADGVFIFGNPALATVPRLWGYPVVESTHVTAGTAIVGGFNRYARIPVRGSVTVEMSNENASNFLEDVWTVKASLRATLAVLRESAFTKVTGL
jgi:HK97 family phage major capsid protein